MNQLTEPLDSLHNRGGYKILVSPQGKVFNQKKAHELSKLDQITFISGRYEGFDERVTQIVDEELSIGDYVLTGGELPSMVMADSIIRLIDNVIRKESHEYESFRRRWIIRLSTVYTPTRIQGYGCAWSFAKWQSCRNWKMKERSLKYKKTLKNRPDIIERINHEK